jgi:hypothetical protein
MPKKNVLNGKFRGRRPVSRPWLRWENNGRRKSSLLLNTRMEEASRGQGYLKLNY